MNERSEPAGLVRLIISFHCTLPGAISFGKKTSIKEAMEQRGHPLSCPRGRHLPATLGEIDQPNLRAQLEIRAAFSARYRREF